MTKKYNIYICPSSGIVLPSIIADIKESLINKGHNVTYFPLNENLQFDYDIAKKHYEDFKPDIAIMIGTNGIMKLEEGSNHHFLDEFKIPYISLFFDFPLFLLSFPKDNLQMLKGVLVWDKKYVDFIESIGYENVDYMPLATNLKRFRKLNIAYEHNISFVGLIQNANWLRDQINSLNKKELAGFDESVRQYRNNGKYVVDTLRDHFKPLNSFEDKISFAKVFDIIDAKLNTMERKQYINALLPENEVVIYSCKAWEEITHKNLHTLPAISYKEGLPYAMNASKINLNITAPQLATTINQRVFDAGAAQSFILTDYRECIYDYFNEDEVAVYKSRDELISKTKFYLENEQSRNNIAQKTYERVKKDHTWDTRVSDIIKMIDRII